MPNADPLLPRPTLLSPSHLARALDALRSSAASSAEVWQLLTQSYTVDLDAVAALMPAEEPEPVWLDARR
ncbi:hypothetical protein [Methylobacterium dankookense]|uniref:Uncharacterized protein n=1 Tax=Methylobacterium dankookense TaxID=560405 RepID=A0A564G000_9HYPH|nr:hypothetical protein [Methylobacterium dankookense]GJD54548.1 hypothetical protein IFDJLNFL_0420 [Methylobacterium dankookense]VUF13298.1 hypothetical protein MTDSW087_02998 [Methylobacterium dankookense]